MNIFKKKLSICVLDFCRPRETAACLSSMRKHVKIDGYELNLLINGGQQSYAGELYGMVDNLILCKHNCGSSYGAVKLFQNANSDFVLYVQNDNAFVRDFTEEDFEREKAKLDTNAAVDFTFLVKLNVVLFSERMFLARRDYWLSTPFSGFGTGPISNGKTNSEAEFHDKTVRDGKPIVSTDEYYISDIGKYAIVQTPSGGIYRRRCDTQQVWVANPPKGEITDTTENLYSFNEEEWRLVTSGKWPPGKVPQNNEKYVFFLYSNEMDPP